MCGRYTLRANSEKLIRRFGITFGAMDWSPRFNVAPTQVMPIIRAVEGGRELAPARWGLIPSWAKDAAIGNRMINARSETAAEKPAFRAPLAQRRCLVPADGFYEWQKTSATRKQPYLITMADGEPFGMAGLWERWRDPDGQDVDSFTILTTAANAAMRPIHERMPVILTPARYASWLDPRKQDVADLMTALPDDALVMHPVSTRVNNPRVDDAACVEPMI